MFVVDVVERVSLHHIYEINRLNNKNAVVSQEVADAEHEIVEVIDVKKNPGCIDDAGRSELFANFESGAICEKAIDRLDTGILSEFRDLGRGLDAQRADREALKTFQEGSIIAADIHNERIRRHVK